MQDNTLYFTPSILGQRTTSSSHFTQVFIGDRSFIFVLPVISKEVTVNRAGIKDNEKIALISSPENDIMLTDDLLNKYR